MTGEEKFSNNLLWIIFIWLKEKKIYLIEEKKKKYFIYI